MAVFFILKHMEDLATETPVEETVETVETPTEVAEESPIPEPTDALDAEVVTEGETSKILEESGEKEVEIDTAPTGEPEVEATPVTFDTELDVSALIEQGKPILAKYELPDDAQAYITALEAKATSPQELAEYAVYGDKEAITSLLERQNYLDSVEEVTEGQYRPRTDKFVETIAADATKVSWLRHDLNKLPSAKYPGLNGFEEIVADGLHIEGESYQDTITRYNDTMTAMRTGATIVPDIPAFIPANLQEAFSKLSKDDRDELAVLDMNEEYDKAIAVNRISQLELMQRGIDADKANAVREVEARNAHQSQMQSRVIETQVKFYDTFRESFAADLAKDVQFSTNPAIQAISSAQNLTLLTQALEDGATGDFARKALTTAGIKFDYPTAKQMMKDVEKASISLANAQSLTDAQGNPLDKVALNRATEEFKSVGKKWQSFAKDIIDQQARLVSTGKAEEVKEAVAKQKIEVKARQVPKGTPTAAVKKDAGNPHPYGSLEYDRWYARRTIEEREAAKARAYQPA